ncbi:unnamed product [Ostreococcus tauri]|uniref:Unnamed product n=1 Tax=Ostreococcus tauri TaxID=70448 RepID=A0A090N415_OSTTA|nr:unnamed product [Ostreococcus tauri]CEF99078.1 unnamed product [Ostreococcus tauri]|eukprot:XP_022839633.1 unnamed product [Ostreococcus tauri]
MAQKENARAERIDAANDSALRALRRRERRCTRALDALASQLRVVRADSDVSTFWTATCMRSSAMLDPKRSVLFVLNETVDVDERERLRSSHAVYTREIETTIRSVMQNLDARSKYDVEYMANKTESLQTISREITAFTAERYEEMHASSMAVIRGINASAHDMFDDASRAARLAAQTMHSTIVNTSIEQALADFRVNVNELGAYASSINLTFQTAQSWFHNFDTVVRPTVESLQDSIGGIDLPVTPTMDIPMPPSLSAPDFSIPSPDLPMDAFTETMSESIEYFSSIVSSASENAYGALVEATSIDMATNVSIPSLLTDYDPPSLRAHRENTTTTDADSFTEIIMKEIREKSNAFGEALQESSSTASDAVGFGVNRTVASMNFITTNSTSTNFEPNVDDFDFLDLDLDAPQMPNILSIADVAFAGLVNVDVTYRVIRCVSAVSKHFAYGALDLEPLNLIDRDRELDVKKVTIYERIARFFADPVMVAIVRLVIFIGVAAAVLYVYGFTRRAYVAGCIDSRNGTFASAYAHSLASSYVDISPRTRSVASDLQLSYSIAQECDSRRARATELFNVAELERHRVETEIKSARERFLAINTCVAVLNEDGRLTHAKSRAVKSCVEESFKLDDSASTTLECASTTCSAAHACVGPIDGVIRAHAVETTCSVESYVHDWLRRTMLFVLAYVSMNVAREPFADAFGRVLALTQSVDHVPVITRYDRVFDDVVIDRDSRERVRRALRYERVRSCAVVVACVACQIPWIVLSRKSRSTS